MYSRLSDILSARWLIYRNEILNYLPLMVSFLNGNKMAISDFGADKENNKPYAVAEGPGKLADRWDLNDIELPENSIAVIPIQGVMVAWKTMELIDHIRMAENNPKIISILFLVNTPGGMVFMTDIAADAIKNSPLPSVAFVLNMAASAGMWLVSACNERIASSQLDRFGSIGVKTSFTDINGFLKDKLGITIYDIYATKATEKDGEIRALLSGDTKPIVDDLDFTNDIFHQVIIQNLGISEDSPAFTGAMFSAKRAIELGLCDRIDSIENAIDAAYKLGMKNRIQSMFNNY